MLLDVQDLGIELAGRTIWQGVHFSLSVGECLGISGPSGCGKSLLMRAIAGLLPIQQGEVYLHGKSQKDWLMPTFRTQVMYLPQRAVLLEGSVEENLRLPFGLGVFRGKSFDVQQAQTLIQALGRRQDFLAQTASSLSGGEGQLLALIRALLVQPTILLLDEPTSALDPQTTVQVEALVQAWLQGDSERACCWVSHDPVQQSRWADRRYVMPPPQGTPA
jgi:putative ABC transport system ATP-binding protein